MLKRVTNRVFGTSEKPATEFQRSSELEIMGSFPQLADVVICTTWVISTFFLYASSSYFRNLGLKESISSTLFHRLLANCIGYSFVVIPGSFTVYYMRRVDYIDRKEKGFLWPLIRICVYGNQKANSDTASVESGKHAMQNEFSKSVILFVFCFCGLQICYLTWGLLQEKIMTQNYNGQKFTDSLFLVFINRIFGLFIATVYIWLNEPDRGQTSTTPPLYKFSFCALSNIMSSWFQSEALKFVTFPTQVLAKTSKLIPMMVMGKLISNKAFESYEYLTALLISMGMTLFLLGSSTNQDSEFSVSLVGGGGFITLVAYMIFDSFTSTWQSELFRSYKISSWRMMIGVNFCALLFATAPLIQQGTMLNNLRFLTEHLDFGLDCIVLSICSALGQLFTYKTIEKFGPVVFTILMSIRQGFAILLSCVIFHHPITQTGLIGISIVFFSLFLRVYLSGTGRRKKVD